MQRGSSIWVEDGVKCKDVFESKLSQEEGRPNRSLSPPERLVQDLEKIWSKKCCIGRHYKEERPNWKLGAVQRLEAEAGICSDLCWALQRRPAPKMQTGRSRAPRLRFLQFFCSCLPVFWTFKTWFLHTFFDILHRQKGGHIVGEKRSEEGDTISKKEDPYKSSGVRLISEGLLGL